MFKFLHGLIGIALGIFSLSYAGVVSGIGNLTIPTLKAVARNPSLYPQIKLSFLLCIMHELLLFFVISLVIISLMIILSRHCSKDWINRGLFAIGAGISILVSISFGSAIGGMQGAYIGAVARNPSLASLLKEPLVLGDLFALIPFIASISISIYLLCKSLLFVKHPTEN